MRAHITMRLAFTVLVFVTPAHALATATASHPTPAEQTLARLENRYAKLLAQHRPDLAERYGAAAYSVGFVSLDEANIGGHLRELNALLSEADTLESGTRADSLRARVRREIAETGPGGALRRDPVLWLDVIDAAARAPFALGSANGCDRTHRGTLQLRTIPEALRGATVLMHGAAPSNRAALEARLGRLELLFRHDLPARTEPCRESRRRADFVEADSLAAASLAQFRLWLSPGE